jgi:hypothetical protein
MIMIPDLVGTFLTPVAGTSDSVVDIILLDESGLATSAIGTLI